MLIRRATESDLSKVLAVHRHAFGQEEEAALVRDILADETARPTLSLLAEEGDRVVGHILFSTARLPPQEGPLRAVLLAPLAVAPQEQGRGIGSKLVDEGLARLQRDAVDLVFVLGDPAFYGRFGFEPADQKGLSAPFELPDAYLGAWRMKSLNSDREGFPSGHLTCCDALNKPELWQE